MALPDPTVDALLEVIASARQDEDPVALVEEIEYFVGRDRELVGLLDGCETLVRYDRITCELTFVPLTTDTIESATNQRSRWIGRPRCVAAHAADPASEAWDWVDPDV